MVTLYQYIFEAFDQVTNFDGLKKFDLNINKFPEDEMKNLMDAIVGGDKLDEIFKCDDNKRFFKIDYKYVPKLKELEQNKFSAELYVKWEGDKGHLYWRGSKILELGEGSVGRLNTKDQELITCKIYNDIFNNETDIEINETNLINLIGDKLDGVMRKDAWKNSYLMQMKSLNKFIPNELKRNPWDYKMVHYSEEDDKVMKAYAGFVKAYKKINNKSNSKDAYDPSDVILYIKGEEENIESILNNCKAECEKDPLNAKKIYLKELFNEGLCIGISLKQIKSGTGACEIFNTGSDSIKIQQVISYTLDDHNGSYLTAKVKGVFNLSNITDEKGEELEGGKEMEVVLRKFGSSQVAVDVNNGGPALGKCPVNVWKGVLGLKGVKGIKANVEKANEFLDTDPQKCEKIKLIIQSALKEGGDCLPFILLH